MSEISAGLRHDVQAEVDGLFLTAGCKSPAECADTASAIVGRRVGPGRDRIRRSEAPLLMAVLRAGISEPKEEAPQ